MNSRLRAAVFKISGKDRCVCVGGGTESAPPPSRARVRALSMGLDVSDDLILRITLQLQVCIGRYNESLHCTREGNDTFI